MYVVFLASTKYYMGSLQLVWIHKHLQASMNISNLQSYNFSYSVLYIRKYIHYYIEQVTAILNSLLSWKDNVMCPGRLSTTSS